LLGVVVDEEAVDEDVAAGCEDALDLLAHLLLLGALELGDRRGVLGLGGRAVDLDLVRVHGRVGDQDARPLDAVRLPDARLLGQQEAIVEVALTQGAADLLDEVDLVEVRRLARGRGEGREGKGRPGPPGCYVSKPSDEGGVGAESGWGGGGGGGRTPCSLRTASTAILAKWSRSCETIFDESVVRAISISDARNCAAPSKKGPVGKAQ